MNGRLAGRRLPVARRALHIGLAFRSLLSRPRPVAPLRRRRITGAPFGALEPARPLVAVVTRAVSRLNGRSPIGGSPSAAPLHIRLAFRSRRRGRPVAPRRLRRITGAPFGALKPARPLVAVVTRAVVALERTVTRWPLAVARRALHVGLPPILQNCEAACHSARTPRYHRRSVRCAQTGPAACPRLRAGGHHAWTDGRLIGARPRAACASRKACPRILQNCEAVCRSAQTTPHHRRAARRARSVPAACRRLRAARGRRARNFAAGVRPAPPSFAAFPKGFLPLAPSVSRQIRPFRTHSGAHRRCLARGIFCPLLRGGFFRSSSMWHLPFRAGR